MRRQIRIEETIQDLHVYHLRINSVKMKVKFQCKMKIDYNNQPLTLEAPNSSNNTYVFNHDITLCEDSSSDNFFTLSISIVTSKGAKYIAALAYLYHTQLIRAADTGPGSKITIPLSKCLDPEGKIEILVNDVVSTGTRQSKSRNNSLRNQRKRLNTEINLNDIEKRSRYQTGQLTPRVKSISGAYQTRSQANFPQSSFRKNPIREHSRSRSKNVRESQSKNKGILSSRASLGLLLQNQARTNTYEHTQEQAWQNSVRESSLNKMRERLRKQEQNSMKEHERRLQLENSENSAKIETMKFKLKCEELQKNMSGKNQNIKNLESRIDELEKMLKGHPLSHSQSQDITCYQILESSHKNQENESLIAILEGKVVNANEELEQLRVKVQRLSRSQAEKQLVLTKQIEKKQSKIEKLQNQLSTVTKNSESWKSKSQQANELTQAIQYKNKVISDLQKQIRENLNRINELEKKNRVNEQSNDDLMKKIEQLTRQHSSNDNEKTRILQNMETYKAKQNMSEFTIGSLKKTIQKLQAELAAATKYRQKYNEAQVEIKKLEGEMKLEHRNFQNSMRISNSNISALQQKYNEDIDSLNRKYQDLESKNLALSLKNKEIENSAIPNLKNEVEQNRRNSDRLQRENQEYKSNDRATKREIQMLETKNNQLQGQLQSYRNKYRSLENLHKIETDKFISEGKRVKQSLEQEVMKQLTLNEKHQAILSQHGATKSKLSYFEEKYNKETKDLSEKVENLRKRNQELEDSLRKKEQEHQQSIEKEKKLVNQIEEYGENQGEYSQLIRKYEKQLSRWENQFRNVEDKLTQKTQDLKKLNENHQQITKKYEETYRKLQETSFENKGLQGELSKLQKESEELQYHLAQSKSAIESKEKAIEKMKNNFEQESKTKTSTKQELVKMEMNYENLTKDYERFREHLYGMLMRQISGVDGLESLVEMKHSQKMKESHSDHMLRFENEGPRSPKTKKSTNFNTEQTQYLLTSPSTASFNNNDIIYAINQFAKDSKVMISKLIEECREMEKEMEKTREQNEKNYSDQKEESEKKNESIKNLEEELSNIYHEKKLTEEEFLRRVMGLEKEIQNLIDEIDKKQVEKEQIIFTLNGVQMEKDSDKDYYQMKLKEEQNIIQKMERKLEQMHINIIKLESSNSNLSSQSKELKEELESAKNMIEKQRKKGQDQSHDLEIANKLLEESKAKNKSLLTQVSELEMLLANEQDKNSKNIELISQEEKKMTDTREFMNNLIKQKQTIVKQQICNNEKIIQLEGANGQLKFSIENLNAKLELNMQSLSSEKENNKKMANRIKNCEQENSILQQNLHKTQIKLKEKEQEFEQVNERLRNITEQMYRETERKDKEIKNYKEQIDVNKKLTTQEMENYQKQINKLEGEILVQVKDELKFTKTALDNTTRDLQDLKRIVEEKKEQINLMRDRHQKDIEMNQRLQFESQRLMDELRSKDEELYEISNQFSNLEKDYHEKIVMGKRQIEQFEEDFEYKYDAMVEDYEGKLDEIEKEKEYFKAKLATNEEELIKLQNRLSTLEFEENQERQVNKNKLMKFEEQKNHMVKNLKEELKRVHEANNRAEEEIKKLKIDLENMKSHEKSEKQILSKMEKKVREDEVRIDMLQRELQGEEQKQKKKQILSRQLEENVVNFQWSLERQVKKQLQNLTKSIVVSLGGENDSKRRIMDYIKEMETRIIRSVGEPIKAPTK